MISTINHEIMIAIDKWSHRKKAYTVFANKLGSDRVLQSRTPFARPRKCTVLQRTCKKHKKVMQNAASSSAGARVLDWTSAHLKPQLV